MRWWHMVRVRLAGLLHRRRLDDQFDTDGQFHLEQETEELLRRGLSPADARRRALAAFGSLSSAKAATRDLRRRPFEQTADDIRYSWRRLWRAPGFTIVAVLTLALGIGANTSLFSLANGLLFRPLSIPNMDALAVIGETHPRATWLGALEGEQAHAIADGAAPLLQTLFTSDPLIGALAVDGHAEFASGELVSGGYFEALGITPRAGRPLEPADDDPSAPLSIVISDRLWREWFASDPSAIGRTARMAGHSLTIIGVAPASFAGTWLPTMMTADFWIPIRAEDALRTVQGGGATIEHRTFARLKPGVTLAELDAVVRVIDGRIRRDPASGRLVVLPAIRGMLFDDYTRPGRLIAVALVALSSLVFLIACANLTNLLLARVAGRSGEMAIRLATGANRLRVFRLILTEVALVTALGGLAGAAFTLLATRVMTRVPLPSLDGIHVRFDPSPDWRVFAFAFGIAAIAALAVGLIPAWRAARTEPLHVLGSGGAAPGVTARGRGLRSTLVAVQMTGSVVLLLAAGLFTRSAIKAYQFNPGYDIRSTAMVSVNMSLHQFDEARGRRLAARLLDDARRIPGVRAAALADALPTSGNAFQFVANAEDPPASSGPHQGALTLSVSPDFFSTMRIPVRRGRAFTDNDMAGTPDVAIVSESLAASLWPGRDPIGRRMVEVRLRPMDPVTETSPNPFARAIAVPAGPELEVVGVATDTATRLTGVGYEGLAFYRPLAQHYSPRFSLVVAAAETPARFVEPLRQVVRAADPELVPMDARTVAETVGVLLTPIRIAAVVLSALGVLGFAIASLGLYGVLTYLVTQRRREFGIRMALGATNTQIRRGLLRSGARMMMAGALPGLALAFIGAGALERLLYAVSPHDLVTFIAVPVGLFVVGCLAAWSAGRQVTRIHPTVALRDL